MGSRYKIRDSKGLYFVTFTVVGWVDLFIRNVYRDCMINSFKFCVKSKGLKLHAYVIMTSHVHAIVSALQMLHKIKSQYNCDLAGGDTESSLA